VSDKLALARHLEDFGIGLEEAGKHFVGAALDTVKEVIEDKVEGPLLAGTLVVAPILEPVEIGGIFLRNFVRRSSE